MVDRAWVSRATAPLLAPLSPSFFPYSVLDVYGALRLSQIVIWIADGGFAPLAAGVGKKKKKAKTASVSSEGYGDNLEPAVLWKEVFGLMIVVFGGETFLALCTRTVPSWLITPKIVLLFAGAHFLQRSTPISRLLPTRPSFLTELILAVPDAINRTLLLTRFSVLPLLSPTSALPLPPNPTTLLLVPFILAVPFAAITFGGFSLFSRATAAWSVPAELKPWGWTMVDAWIPLVIAPLYLTLMGPVQGWAWGVRDVVGAGAGGWRSVWGEGAKWSEEESFSLCAVLTATTFVLRTIWNMGGPRGEGYKKFFGRGGGKIKTA